MPTAPGPRFVLEAGFLVLLAVVVGLADLDPLLIVLVMLVGWILVSLIEYFAWRQSQSAMMRGFEPAVAGVSVDEMVADDDAASSTATTDLRRHSAAAGRGHGRRGPDCRGGARGGAEEEAVESSRSEEPPAPEEPGAPAEDSEAIAFATAEEQAHRASSRSAETSAAPPLALLRSVRAARGARRGRQ